MLNDTELPVQEIPDLVILGANATLDGDLGRRDLPNVDEASAAHENSAEEVSRDALLVEHALELVELEVAHEDGRVARGCRCWGNSRLLQGMAGERLPTALLGAGENWQRRLFVVDQETTIGKGHFEIANGLPIQIPEKVVLEMNLAMPWTQGWQTEGSRRWASE